MSFPLFPLHFSLYEALWITVKCAISLNWPRRATWRWKSDVNTGIFSLFPPFFIAFPIWLFYERYDMIYAVLIYCRGPTRRMLYDHSSVFSSVVPSAMSIIYTETFATTRDLCLLPDNDDYCSFVVICSQQSIHFYRDTWFMADTSKFIAIRCAVLQKDTSGNHCSILLTEVK